MPASLKFESAAGTAAATLTEVKLVTLTDNTGNEYTLDITTNDLKVGYTPNGGQITEHKITGLSTALGSLLSTKDNNESVLVDTLGNFLDSPDKAKYDGQNNQTVKEFLVGKGLKGDKGDTGPKGADGKDGAQGLKGDKGDTGLKGADGTSPSAAEIAAEKALQEYVTKISIESPEFKRAVQEEMSQPSFDIPTSDDAALNWTW
ncbi:hypothetical protein [Wolbachia endosymbiont (group A) of Icerya purchasi]|uniref:hypothetical protein n=1 Tax=Wolbachia endosymbiont (group A) of Icerya purchasi TaxID=2954019 RepID=UPI002231C940|nr:hypothetical protein [Wolbachia endosymbiont (group A) of Icerya purchasi]